MAYIGRQLARGENKLFDDISSSFNGSTTVFNLTVSSVATATATPYQLFVSLGGVMQKPNTDFTTAGNQITFTTAPAAGLSCWIMMQGDTIDNAAVADASITPSKISGSNFAFSGDLRLKDADGSHYVGFASPSTVSTNKVWTLPGADGTSGQFLKTNGSAVLSWDTVDTSTLMPLTGGIFTGDVTFDGATAGYDIVWDKSDNALEWADNAKAKFGTGGDLEIFHNASNSVINDAGTGDLLLQVGGSTKATVSSTGFGVTGALTVSTNATISGNLTVSGTTTTVDSVTLSVKDKNIEMGVVSSPSDTTADGGGITLKGASDKTFNWVDSTDAWTSSEHIHLLDSKKLLVGTGSDFQLIHDGTNTFIQNKTGYLKIANNVGGDVGGDIFIQAMNGEDSIKCIHDGAVEVYHNNVKKLETTSGGINVTGAISVNGAALASGNTFTAVADGSIANNKPVMIQTNGTVAEIKEVPTVLATPTQNSQADHGPTWNTDIRWLGAAYGRTHSTVFLAYMDYNTDTKMVLLQPSGTNLATITKPDIQIVNEKWYYLDAAYDVDNNKYGVIGVDQGTGNYPKFVFANSSSSTNLSAGSSQTLRAGNGASSEHFPRICYCGSGRFAVLYTDYGTSETVYVRILTWNGSNNYTAGTEVAVHTYCKGSCIAYHADSGKLIIAYREEQNGNDTVAVVGTISGSGGSATVTLSSEHQVNGADTGRGGQIIVDDSTNKIVYCGRSDNGNTFQSVVMSLSGTTLTAGSAVTIDGSSISTADDRYPHLSYIDKANKVLITYCDSNGTSNIFKEGTVSTSSNTITWSANRAWGTGQQNRYTKMVPLYGDSLGRVLRNHAWNDSGYFKGKTQGMTYIQNISNFQGGEHYVGFADQAYTNGQTATIKTYGNHVDTLSGLSTGSRYYVQPDGTVGTSSATPVARAGLAIAAGKLIIMYPTEWGG